MEKRMKNEIQIWQGPNGVTIPTAARNAEDIVPFAHYLNERQRNQIVAAFQIEAYDMAAEYAWKKAMTKLKETLSTLGMRFIGEMLGRDDFDESSSIDSAITDYTAIQLAEQLGVIGATAALKLKQSNELITHFFSKGAEEELDHSTAFGIVKSSIQYILGEQDISVAIEFSDFRNRLLSETLKENDQIDTIVSWPLFHLRTVLTVLLSSIKNDKGAKLEHALANINLLLPHIWNKIADNDKWNIGTAYRDVTADGNTTAIAGLKSALMKIGGFDFVPENLRSMTFVKAAKQVIETHFAYNNYYNEPAVVAKLANLGTTIPAPALIECIQAYLAVYLGNIYGESTKAARIAEDELSKLTKERWEYYFSKVIQNDDVILNKFRTIRQIDRFKSILSENGINDLTGLPKLNQALYNAILSLNYKRANSIAGSLLSKIKD